MLISRGDSPQKLESAYQRLFPIIREKCARMLADHAESQDVAQETFIRLWKAGLADGNPHQTTAWVFRTSTRLAIDLMRRRRSRAASPLELNEESAPHAADLENSAAARWELQKIARRVPRRELEMAILRRVDGLRHQEIAEVLKTSERSVRRVLKRFDARVEALQEA